MDAHAKLKLTIHSNHSLSITYLPLWLTARRDTMVFSLACLAWASSVIKSRRPETVSLGMGMLPDAR